MDSARAAGRTGSPGASRLADVPRALRQGLPRLGGLDAPALREPLTVFQKIGFELLPLLGFIDRGGVSADAADHYADLLANDALDEATALAVGAELLRQGVVLEESVADAIRDAVGDLPEESETESAGRTGDVGADLGDAARWTPGLPGGRLILMADTFEPDDTPATCGSIPTDGTPQDRSLDPAGDNDYVCFDAACGDSILIEGLPIPPATTGPDTFFELFDPDGFMIAADDDDGIGLLSLISTPADKTGTHVLRVRGFSATTTGNYRLTVLTTPGTCTVLDPTEPNETAASCAPLPTDGTYTSHWIRPLGDQDWFCFDVTECGTAIVVDLNETGETLPTERIQVFNPSGLERLNTTSTTPQTVLAMEVGTWTVLITGSTAPGANPLYDNGVDNNIVQYDFSVALNPPTGPCDALEPDNEQGACSPLPLDGTPVAGHSISPTGDEDWFCLQLDCNDTISITVTPIPTGDPTSLRPRIELWGPTSTALVLSVTGTVNGNPITLNRAANHAGTWFARVLRASTASAAVQVGPYEISALRTAVPNALCDPYEADSAPDQCVPPADLMGGLQSKAIFPARDEDWICLGMLTCGDTVAIETFATPPANLATNTIVDLYRLPNTTTTVATNNDKVAGNVFSLVSYTLSSPAQNGSYVARVRGSSTTITGPYDVGVTVTVDDCPEPDAFEPDGSPALCNPLPATGTPVLGHNIFPVGDLDYFCVDLACGDNLDVTVTPTTGSLRPIIQVTNPDGLVLGTVTSPAAGTPITFSNTNNDAGTYSVRVSGSTNTIGGYRIEASTSPGLCLLDPFEPDNDRASCRAVSLPVTESRALNPLTDSDYYCFLLDCGEGVSVTLTPSPTLRAILRLRSPTNGILTTVTAAAAGDVITLVDAVATPGQYAIEVDGSSNTTGLYDITIESFAGFQCVDDYEPDATRDACQPIPTDGTRQVRTLLPHPDEDWACFQVTDCGLRITVETLPPSPLWDDADTEIQLYNPSGLLVASDETSGAAPDYSRIVYTMRETDELGEWAVRIFPDVATSAGDEGQYDLSVRAEDVKLYPIVPPVEVTLLPDATQLDAQALTEVTIGGGDYAVFVEANPFIDISATGAPLGADGLSAHPGIPIGFPFNFFGNTYTEAVEQDNGLLTFSDPTWIAGIGNECIPDASTPNEYIAAFWEDLQQGVGAAEVYVQTLGAPGSQMFICQFDQNPIPGGTNVTLEIILYEGTHEIEFRYGTMTGPAADGNSATVGLEDLTGTNGVQFSCNTPFGFSGSSIRFVPGVPPEVVLVDYPSDAACYGSYDVAADTAAFIDIAATGNLIAPDFTDDSFRTIPFPLAFPYFGLLESGVINVGSNGFVNFGTGATALTNQCPLPNATAPNGTIAPLWDDLFPVAGTSAAYWEVFGTPGSGSASMVIQWTDWARFGCSTTSHLTFEVVLYETGLIELRYLDVDAGTCSTFSPTLGIEDRNGTSGVTYACATASGGGPIASSGMRVTFTPAGPPPARFTWLDPPTLEELGTGPTYLHPLDGACEVLLNVLVRDPSTCCPLTAEELVELPDRGGPAITVQPQLADGCMFLWPPAHGHADFTLAETGIEAVDLCGNGAELRFSAQSSSSQAEDDPDLGDGSSVDDVMISPDGQTISLRAERSGACGPMDRTYTLYVEAVDSLGNVSVSEPFSVCVYHDQGHEPPGPYRSANPGSSSDDTRPGWTEGGYGVGCGPGCSLECDPTQDLP
jgi:hypothetical protein